MDLKRLFILLTLLLLVTCVLMDKGEGFVRPKSKEMEMFQKDERCSRRMSESGTKADVITPLDINDMPTILVGYQYYNFQKLSLKKSLKYASKVTLKVPTETNKLY